MQPDNPVVICITPVRNEVWILERFLTAASLWADHIIIADQNSTDGSVEIASRFPKVRIIKNELAEYDEPMRQVMLLNAAREISGKRIIIALDADEFLTANFHSSPEWQTILNAKPGTVISFDWVNVNPDFTTAYLDRLPYNLAYVDDGAPHVAGKRIHSQRVPLHQRFENIYLNEIKVLHYAYVIPARNLSKQRWYMCWEQLNIPNQDPYSIYRKYFRHNKAEANNFTEIKNSWLDNYIGNGIDMTSVKSNFIHSSISGEQKKYFQCFRWDFEVLEWIEKYGTQKFAMLDIWDFDWQLFASVNEKKNTEMFSNPRTTYQKFIFNLIKKLANGDYPKLVSGIIESFLYRFVFRKKW